MRKSLLIASLLASASAVNAEVYIDGAIQWKLYTPYHENFIDTASSFVNSKCRVSISGRIKSH